MIPSNEMRLELLAEMMSEKNPALVGVRETIKGQPVLVIAAKMPDGGLIPLAYVCDPSTVGLNGDESDKPKRIGFDTGN